MPVNGHRSLSNFTIGAFNVRGLSSATKRDQLSVAKTSTNRTSMYVCCMQETKCPSDFDVISGYYRLIGLPSTSRHYGLAFSLASYLADELLRYWSVSDRLAVIQLSLGSHSTLTIINPADITPVYKKGDASLASNYRPISITPAICRLFERILADSINYHMHAHNLITDSQYGFVKGRSTELQLLNCTNIWIKSMDQKLFTDTVYIIIIIIRQPLCTVVGRRPQHVVSK